MKRITNDIWSDRKTITTRSGILSDISQVVVASLTPSKASSALRGRYQYMYLLIQLVMTHFHLPYQLLSRDCQQGLRDQVFSI